MSNRNQVNNNKTENSTNGQQAPDTGAQQPQKEKTTIAGKILHVRDKIMASKAGRIVVRGLKVVGVGGLAYASYRAGARSVKPTTVYIREGVTEPEEKPVEEPEETPAETTEAAE